ncbi:hypothetical protein [Couchioplanes caeruleus]|uniref:hypothetical protein n=1 Tax=Couchioplanes caeruleus TaxID=56438 RepID=UPI0014759E01|nr:hypothetical protein [Couchioplanes caeruleus]
MTSTVRPAAARATAVTSAVARSARPVSGPARPGFVRVGRPRDGQDRVPARAAAGAVLG